MSEKSSKVDNMKVLNLYAGIGGNRKLWDEVVENLEVTAVEIEEEIAEIYHDNFPQDKVIVEDAHEFLKENYEDYDFIWSSPPCPTHSRMNHLSQVQEGKTIDYPDMKLYEEIIYLKNWYSGNFCVENVITYYEPLIDCIERGNHYLWTNFFVSKIDLGDKKIKIRGSEKNRIEFLRKKTGFNLSSYDITQREERDLLNNCVHPDLGKHIIECAFSKETKKIEEFVNIKG